MSSSCLRPMTKSPKSNMHRSLHPVRPGIQLSSMVKPFNHPMLFLILAHARQTLSSAHRIGWHRMSGTNVRIPRAVWIVYAWSTRPNVLDHLRPRYSGQLALLRHTLCMLQELCRGAGPTGQAVSPHLCRERCRGRIVVGSSGVCQNNQNGTGLLYRKNQRTVAMTN